jgi:BolA family transcriptional regulator, general stress-responsive regulator
MSNIRDQIELRLQTLKPDLLEVVDDSAAHAGHAGATAHAARHAGAQALVEGTHFEITVVSAAFAGKPLVARHRMIYALLDDLMKTQIHALKIDAQVSP